MTSAAPARPHREAARITKMLDAVLGEDRFDRAPVDVAELAMEYSRNVAPDGPIHCVEEADIAGCVGALVCSDSAPRQWAIMYNRGQSEGRRAFTIGHEFGHFVLHRTAIENDPEFEHAIYCDEEAVVQRGGSGIEEEADSRGHRGLSSWLSDAEDKWNEHSNRQEDGTPNATLSESLDHLQKLTKQFPVSSIRILYPASGTRLCACWIEDENVIIDKNAYWAPASSVDEAAYVAAIINSQTVLDRVKDLQPVGQRDPRHFDNLVWTLPIPEFDETDSIHRELAEAALHAADVAAGVALPDEAYFTTKRAIVRQVLIEDGVAEAVERLVDALLPS